MQVLKNIESAIFRAAALKDVVRTRMQRTPITCIMLYWRQRAAADAGRWAALTDHYSGETIVAEMCG